MMITRGKDIVHSITRIHHDLGRIQASLNFMLRESKFLGGKEGRVEGTLAEHHAISLVLGLFRVEHHIRIEMHLELRCLAEFAVLGPIKVTLRPVSKVGGSLPTASRHLFQLFELFLAEDLLVVSFNHRLKEDQRLARSLGLTDQFFLYVLP